MTMPLFPVIRRCAAGECEPGCNCHVVTVDVEVDELTAEEVTRFQETGSAEQRAEIAAYLGPGPVSVTRPTSRAA